MIMENGVAASQDATCEAIRKAVSESQGPMVWIRVRAAKLMNVGLATFCGMLG